MIKQSHWWVYIQKEVKGSEVKSVSRVRLFATLWTVTKESRVLTGMCTHMFTAAVSTTARDGSNASVYQQMHG